MGRRPVFSVEAREENQVQNMIFQIPCGKLYNDIGWTWLTSVQQESSRIDVKQFELHWYQSDMYVENDQSWQWVFWWQEEWKLDGTTNGGIVDVATTVQQFIWI